MPSRGKIGDINEVLRTDEELSIEWQITDFFKLSSAVVDFECADFFVSPEINFVAEDWFLSVWPSGMSFASNDWVELYLFRKSNGPRRMLDVSVGIKGADEERKEKRHEFSTKDDGCGWSNFYLRSMLQNRNSNLMPDGVLTITCDVKKCVPNVIPSNTNDVLSCEEAAVQLEAVAGRSQSSEEQDITSNQEAPIQTEAISEGSQSTENRGPPLNRHSNVIRSMKALLEGGRRSDFKLKLGGGEWYLHKMILESRSPYFADMLQGEWAESTEGEVLAVNEVNDAIREDALYSVLQFIYTGEVEDLYVEDLCDLYIAADRCKMDELKLLCVDSMKENMCEEIVCGALSIAKKYKEDELNEVALVFFIREAAKIFLTEEWERLRQKHPEMLADLLEESAKRGKVIC